MARTRIPRMAFPLAATLAAAAALIAAGCGGGSSTTTTTVPSAASAPPATTPRRAPIPPPASAADERVIRAWTSALRHGHPAAAAHWFALPAIVQTNPGAPDVVLRTRNEVIAFGASLPCGATVIRTEKRGAYAETLFRLVTRPGAVCDGPGQTARAAFRIEDGRIVEWRRRLDQPDDATAQPDDPRGGDSGAGAPAT